MNILIALFCLTAHAQNTNFDRAIEGRERRLAAEKQAEWQARVQNNQALFVRALLNFAGAKGGGTNMYCRSYMNPWDPRSNVPICDGAACVQVDSDKPRVGLPLCFFDASANEFCQVWGASYPWLEVFAKCVDARGEETLPRKIIATERPRSKDKSRR